LLRNSTPFEHFQKPFYVSEAYQNPAMPPKKSAPAKKKEGNPESGGELTSEMQAKMFMLTCQSLQLQLAERSEEASRALAAKRELQSRVEQISKDFDEEEKQTFEITQDMTRQYKGMQEELLGRVCRHFMDSTFSHY
jgi:hypothetical protein